jgi:hypothetical protein
MFLLLLLRLVIVFHRLIVGVQLLLVPERVVFVIRTPWVAKSAGEIEKRIAYWVKVQFAVQVNEGWYLAMREHELKAALGDGDWRVIWMGTIWTERASDQEETMKLWFAQRALTFTS